MGVSTLRAIPGVGKETEKDLLLLGYTTPEDLKNADPEEMYRSECAIKGVQVDICQLYVYRCVVYYCRTPEPEPEKCKWWYWKNHNLEE